MIRFRLYVASITFLIVMSLPVFAASAAPSKNSDDALAKKHSAAGLTCKQCHTAGIPAKNVANKNDFPRIATKEACLKCHGNYKEIATGTTNYQKPFNPHYSHYGELECYQCHHVHQTSELFCNSCHTDMKIPKTGWKATKNPADE